MKERETTTRQQLPTTAHCRTRPKCVLYHQTNNTYTATVLRSSGRSLLQSPGAYGDVAYTANAADPWGTASGYYDPYGPGYVPGFVNIDISQQYGTHVDLGPVAVDLTTDYAGFALGSLAGLGIARDGRGFDVQLGNGNIMDLSVSKGAGFGLWLFNGLVNINVGPDGRWSVVPSASSSTAVTVQGIQDAAAVKATATSSAPSAAAAAAKAAANSTASTPNAPAPAAVEVAKGPAPSPSPAVRKPCEGGTVVKVEGELLLGSWCVGAGCRQAGGSNGAASLIHWLLPLSPLHRHALHL